MNTWQCLRQIQYLTRAQAWEDSSTKVFHSGSVIVTSAPNEQIVETLIAPFCLIRPLGLTVDDEEPELFEQEVLVTLAVVHEGDSYGEYPLMGGQRAGQQASSGRGLLEIEEELFNAVHRLNTDDGIVIQHWASSATQPDFVSGRLLLFRDYLFKLLVTSDRYYHPVINFSGA